jgi:hypothetical protein
MNEQQNNLWDYLNPWGTYQKTLGLIEDYNRADTVNMDEKELNKFRHIAGPAYLTSRYFSPEVTKTLGWGKEAKDLVVGRGLADTQNDLTNNIKGIEIGLGDRNVKGNHKNLFDYIFETEIKPYRE